MENERSENVLSHTAAVNNNDINNDDRLRSVREITDMKIDGMRRKSFHGNS